MKTTATNRSIWLMAALLLLGATLYALPGNDEELTDTINYRSYYGRVIDAQSDKALPFATIEALGSNTATVTNIDGEFTIKIERNADVSQLKISYLGFQNKILELENFTGRRSFTVKLDPSSIQLKQVTIRPKDAMELIADVLDNIRNNYSDAPMMMRGFYRETIQRGKNYVSISEAVIDVYKGSYSNEYQVDRVKLFKGRKSADVERMDTVLFKVQGGPNTTILMDVVKNPYILLSEEYLNIYDFRLTDVITIDDRLHYVISFNQKEYVDDPYYWGRLYIEMDKLAISEVEFELNVENQDEAARLFIQRKPMGM
ncbi:MAG: carboxypeptidase-like regulatory domain-containing protein, partial [Bacteroidales bacterium]|nr:carboxypeptidase-like regulatory domain-containing protein [Bacteroidales bacterium]